ncbi:hypothetical protein L1987_09396 [Smallanthus sonchifolius]|uniref:Uncharacterized protein n=1 Tax=Smallanthus sonchifolius TaxID=185202 RepID=A0ACB9JPK6_9ASTR|nr:hypothetical protein L1987_09396 [Smallanthus sonchifolius]
MDSAPGEPNSDANLKKTEVKYKGVRRRTSGRFAAEIRDSKKRARVWLGTYLSATEAAKAYDKAAFEIKGRKASLSFPLELGISPPEPNAATKTAGRKRTKDVSKTIDAVKHNIRSNDNGKRESFKWTDQSLCAM